MATTTDLSLSATNIILACLTGIYGFIFTPIQVYYCRIFWRLNKKRIPFFSKRHPKLVLFGTALINLYPLLFRPISDFSQINHLLHDYHPVIFFTTNITQLYAIVCFVRLWLLYFDFNHELGLLSSKWTSLLLQNEKDRSMTLKNKWMGNMKYLAIFGIISGIIVMSIVTFSNLYHRTQYKHMHFLFTQSQMKNSIASSVWPQHLTFTQSFGFVFVGLMLLLSFKIRKCRDNLAIKGTKEVCTTTCLT